MQITIFGGHGKVAQHIEQLLVREGHEVNGVIRNPDHAEAMHQLGVNPVVADVERMDTDEIAELLEGTDAVIWSAGAGGGDPERTYAVDRDAAIRSMDASVAAKVPRYVMVSYLRSGRDEVPEDDPFHPYAQAKAAADDHLRQTSLNWTILGPGRLTEDEPTGSINTDPDLTQGDVSRINVALVAEQVLSRSDLNGVTINFVDGDQPISRVLGSDLTFPKA